MNAAMSAEQGHTYMRGKSRQWFWASTGMMAVLFVLISTDSFVYNQVFGRMQEIDTALILGLGVLYTAVHTAVWTIVPLAYGLHNEIRIFKAFFIVRAVLQIPYMVIYFLTCTGMSYVFPNLFAGPAIYDIYRAASSGAILFWVVFMIVVLLNGKTGKTLRKSAVAVLVTTFLYFLYSLFFEAIYQGVYSVNEAWAAILLAPIMKIFIGVLFIVPIVVFLWAMAFTRQREEKTPGIQKAV